MKKAFINYAIMVLLLLSGCSSHNTQPNQNNISLTEKPLEWIIFESDHFIFYVLPGSLAEQEISTIIDIQEKAYLLVSSALQTDLEAKIDYYLYNSREMLGKDLGLDDPPYATADRDIRVLATYQVYNEEIKAIGAHEIVHLFLNNKFRIGSIMLLEEGIAFYFDKLLYGHDLKTIIRGLIASGSYHSIQDLADPAFAWKIYKSRDIKDMSFGYQGGAFIEFLVEKFGFDFVLELREQSGKRTLIKHLENLSGEEIMNLEEEFLKWVEN